MFQLFTGEKPWGKYNKQEESKNDIKTKIKNSKNINILQNLKSYYSKNINVDPKIE